MASSSSAAALALDDASKAVKPVSKSVGTNKRRRPTFRPASQRKGSTTKQKPSSAVAVPSDRVEPEPPAAASANDQVINDEISGVTLPPVTSKTPRRAGKKRKVSTGVAIGSSRQLREHQETALEEGAIASQPSAVSEPSVPPALPGQLTLQAYCSKYRSKEKRKKKAEIPARAPEPDAPAAEAAAPTSGPVVQVVNGEIVLQESSMVVPGARRSVQEVEEEFQHVVEEEAHTAVVGASYNSFVSRRKPQHWTVDETRLFYHALRQVGADFGTMEAYFDTRTRKQLKRKFQVESSQRPNLIAMALNPKSQMPLDMSVFNVQVEPPSTTNKNSNNEPQIQTSPPLVEPPSATNKDSIDEPQTQASPPLTSPATPPPAPPLEESRVSPPPSATPSSPQQTLYEPSISSVLATETVGEEMETAQQPDEPVVTDTLFDEVEAHFDSETQISVAIPPVAPARTHSAATRKKRPKFKATKSKPRTK